MQVASFGYTDSGAGGNEVVTVGDVLTDFVLKLRSQFGRSAGALIVSWFSR